MNTMANNDTESSSVLGLFKGVYNFLKTLSFLDTVLPSKLLQKNSSSTTGTTSANSKNTTNYAEKSLFPKKIIVDKDAFKESTAVACSANGTSKLVKVENVDGSISWSFDHDYNNTNTNTAFSNMNSPFLTSTGSTVSGGFSPMVNLNVFTSQKDSPSPLAMEQRHATVLTTHTSDLDSANSLEEELTKIPDLPDPEFFDIGHDHLDEEDEGEEDEGEESDASIDQKTGKKKRKSYTCEFCGSEFRIRGYLTRHIKKHALNKAYECPFFDEHAENKCHPNGGFSRRDTYKTHLKARHFKYPPGTRSQDRAITAGKCGLCNKPYESNEDWVEKHIEAGECEGLPKGYTGRVKNSRRKNYEYPNPQQISPISSNSGNDSPMTSKSSPNNLVLPQHMDSVSQQPLQDSIAGVSHLTPGSMSTTPEGGPNVKFNAAALQFSHEYNDYDNNDEFSLDVEQCMSFKPLMTGDYTY